MLVTVVEMPEFHRRAKALLSEAERNEVINHLAANPAAGIQLGGGLRKVRFGRAGGGKRGGVRTIHFYMADSGPIYLLTLFAKNEKDNLSADELALLLQLGETLAAQYGKRQ